MKNKKEHLKSATILAGAAMVPTAAVFVSGMITDSIAGSVSQTMTVTANVNAACKFPSAANTLAFGAYDPIGVNASTDLDSSSNFDVKCNKGTNVVLKLGLGLSPSGQQRRLKLDASNFLNYNLYSDATRTTIWNDTSNVISYTAASSTTETKTVYGRIPAGQDASAGSYSDTVIITADF